ncbi:MAG: folate-binding protein [Rhodanobacteraceae bacterium]
MAHAMDPVVLGRAELIEISGPDAVAFAHAQLSSDVASLAVGAWQWSAWLNAQGRTRAVFALLRVASDRLLLWSPLGDARTISEALSRFVLRAKAKLATVDDFAVHALDARELAPSPSTIAMHANGHAIALPGERVAWLAPLNGERFDIDALGAWRLADIGARLPWIDVATRDEFVAQALDLDTLGAVRLDKGCYPGQEIVARLHFRGGNKHHLHRIVLSGEADATPGLAIGGPAGSAGTVLYAARSAPSRSEALAVIADSALDASSLTSASGHIISF